MGEKYWIWERSDSRVAFHAIRKELEKSFVLLFCLFKAFTSAIDFLETQTFESVSRWYWIFFLLAVKTSDFDRRTSLTIELRRFDIRPGFMGHSEEACGLRSSRKVQFFEEQSLLRKNYTPSSVFNCWIEFINEDCHVKHILIPGCIRYNEMLIVIEIVGLHLT